MTCAPQIQTNGVNSLWNPAPGFAYIEAQGAGYLQAHNPPLDQFLVDIKNGTPAAGIVGRADPGI